MPTAMLNIIFMKPIDIVDVDPETRINMNIKLTLVNTELLKVYKLKPYTILGQ